MSASLVVITAIALDLTLGEPKKWHPIVGLGNLANLLEKRLNPKKSQSDPQQVLAGTLACIILLMPAALIFATLDNSSWGYEVLAAVVLYLAIALRSLSEHAKAIQHALDGNDLSEARNAVGMIVSRDTQSLDEEGVAKAGIESVLENANDGIFGAIFWFLLAGLPGVIVYRIVNTLDAMWGYKSERYNYFGRAAARLDDVMNYIPARLTALSFSFAGDRFQAWACWKLQAKHWKSPNAGPVMAAGAGALNLRLGGTAVYDGKQEERPALGTGAHPVGGDIDRTIRLVRRSLLIWVAVIIMGDLLSA